MAGKRSGIGTYPKLTDASDLCGVRKISWYQTWSPRLLLHVNVKQINHQCSICMYNRHQVCLKKKCKLIVLINITEISKSEHFKVIYTLLILLILLHDKYRTSIKS